MAQIARRLAFYIAAGWVAVTVNFLIPRAMPGNTVDAMMAKFPHLDPSAFNALSAEFGVGHSGSLWHQYVTYLGNLVQGNFGTDLSQYPASVGSLLRAAIPWTLALVGTATIISFVLGTLLGIAAAWRRGGWLDRFLPGFTFLQATPYFFLALLLVEFLAVKLNLFPEQRGYGNGLMPSFTWPFISSAIYHALLPALSIIATSIGGWMLGMRNVMITTIGEDYVLAAQAKGLRSRRIIFTYAARNAILPNISAFALSIGFIVGGALVMEIVFDYPGVGTMLFNAVTSNDYPMLQAVFLIIALAVLLANLLADIVYVMVDPRARLKEAR